MKHTRALSSLLPGITYVLYSAIRDVTLSVGCEREKERERGERERKKENPVPAQGAGRLTVGGRQPEVGWHREPEVNPLTQWLHGRQLGPGELVQGVTGQTVGSTSRQWEEILLVLTSPHSLPQAASCHHGGGRRWVGPKGVCAGPVCLWAPASKLGSRKAAVAIGRAVGSLEPATWWCPMSTRLSGPLPGRPWKLRGQGCLSGEAWPGCGGHREPYLRALCWPRVRSFRQQAVWNPGSWSGSQAVGC